MWKNVLPFLPVFLTVLALLVWGFWEKRKLENASWVLKKEGIFDEVSYGQTTWKRRVGAMAHTTRYETVRLTFLYFDDGSSLILNGLYSVDFPKGTKMRIFAKGGDYAYKIEKA